MKNVHQKSGRYYYVKKSAGKTKWTALTRVEEGDKALAAALRAVHSGPPRNLSDLFDAFVKSPAFARYRDATQRSYRSALQGSLQGVFGAMQASELRRTHVAQYLQKRQNQGHGPAGNREIAALSSCLNWAEREGLADIRESPTHGVRRNSEKPKTRLVSVSDVEDALVCVPVQVRHMMRAAFLTGLRQRDLINLRREDVTSDGIRVDQSKDGKHILVTWSAELRRLVDAALARSTCSSVFTNSKGHPWTSWGFQTAYQRNHPGFTFHDLRASAASHHPTGLPVMSRYVRRQVVAPVR